jgi:hypothetical protein
MSDAVWDELFAKAEGSEDVVVIPETKVGGGCEAIRSQKRKRKGKTCPSMDRIGHYDEAVSDMLQSRMTLQQQEWPDWISLGCYLLSSGKGQCRQFEPSPLGGDNKSSVCKNCQQPALYHRILCNTRTTHPCLSCFCYVRNIRSIAKLWILRKPAKINNFNPLAMQAELTQLKDQLGNLHLQQRVPTNEFALLESKLQSLAQRVKLISKIAVFEDLVRIIIGCDEIYYRLYYLQITDQMPTMTMVHQDGAVKFMFLPHPTQYFGLEDMTMDPTTILESQQWCRHNITLPESCLQRMGYHSPSTGSRDQANGNDNHPLETIRRIRLIETVSIFRTSGWSQSEATRKEVMRSLVPDPSKRSMEEEETPAPSLLMEWRDSCRDFLCHLYAYATLSTASLSAMARFAKGGILEHGAGTGYLAHILTNKYKVKVEAFDVCPSVERLSPTSTLNDYHGLTPGFTKVHKGGIATLRRHSGDARTVTLLLCYPPPKSSMAYDMLKAFTDQGGMLFIHVGEFRGLTGSKEFEEFLLCHYQCDKRFPCLSWGTDAAEVTLWRRRSSDETGDSLLLPCSYCGKREAVSRCRLLRYLVYCSKKCCKQDAVSRGIHLNQYMIDLPDVKCLEFRDDTHFSLLGRN